eukprot:Gb_10225 [translate_table: standard]
MQLKLGSPFVKRELVNAESFDSPQEITYGPALAVPFKWEERPGMPKPPREEKLGLQMDEDAEFYNLLLTREGDSGQSSRSSYRPVDLANVPFDWETEPGMPKTPPTEQTKLVPLSPPPCLQSASVIQRPREPASNTSSTREVFAQKMKSILQGKFMVSAKTVIAENNGNGGKARRKYSMPRTCIVGDTHLESDEGAVSISNINSFFRSKSSDSSAEFEYVLKDETKLFSSMRINTDSSATTTTTRTSSNSSSNSCAPHDHIVNSQELPRASAVSHNVRTKNPSARGQPYERPQHLARSSTSRASRDSTPRRQRFQNSYSACISDSSCARLDLKHAYSLIMTLLRQTSKNNLSVPNENIGSAAAEEDDDGDGSEFQDAVAEFGGVDNCCEVHHVTDSQEPESKVFRSITDTVGLTSNAKTARLSSCEFDRCKESSDVIERPRSAKSPMGGAEFLMRLTHDDKDKSVHEHIQTCKAASHVTPRGLLSCLVCN